MTEQAHIEGCETCNLLARNAEAQGRKNGAGWQEVAGNHYARWMPDPTPTPGTLVYADSEGHAEYALSRDTHQRVNVIVSPAGFMVEKLRPGLPRQDMFLNNTDAEALAAIIRSSRGTR